MKISKRNIRRIRRGIADARLKIRVFEGTGSWRWWSPSFEHKLTESAYARTLSAWSAKQAREKRERE